MNIFRGPGGIGDNGCGEADTPFLNAVVHVRPAINPWMRTFRRRTGILRFCVV
jgi:hypothetical protein